MTKQELLRGKLEQKDRLDYEILELKRDIKCLTMNEFHTIDVIGNRTLPMNELADDLSVTMGTATVAIENLVKKNFVKRERIQEDRRRVFVSLTKIFHE